jgi:hypothetical protein
MAKQRVPFHLAETNAAPCLPALDGLVGQVVDGADGPHLAEQNPESGAGGRAVESTVFSVLPF